MPESPPPAWHFSHRPSVACLLAAIPFAMPGTTTTRHDTEEERKASRKSNGESPTKRRSAEPPPPPPLLVLRWACTPTLSVLMGTGNYNYWAWVVRVRMGPGIVRRYGGGFRGREREERKGKRARGREGGVRADDGGVRVLLWERRKKKGGSAQRSSPNQYQLG